MSIVYGYYIGDRFKISDVCPHLESCNSSGEKGVQMAKVYAQVTGGTMKELQANTVSEVKAALDAKTYAATVNGEPQHDDFELSDFEVITLAPAVKGA